MILILLLQEVDPYQTHLHILVLCLYFRTPVVAYNFIIEAYKYSECLDIYFIKLCVYNA